MVDDETDGLDVYEARQVFRNRPFVARTTDYRKKPVIAAISHLDNYSVYIVFKQDEAAVQNAIVLSIGVAIAAAAVLTVVGLVVLLCLTTRMIRQMDEESNIFKAQVKVEKDKFTHSMRQLLPTHMIARLSDASQMVVADYSPHALVGVVDISGYSDISRSWNARLHVRFMSYYYTVVTRLAERLHVFPVKMFGDVFCCVHSLGRLEEDVRATNIMELTSFAALLHHIFSPEYTHGGYNDNKSIHRPSAAGDPPEIQLSPLMLRVGLHCGPVCSGFLNNGLTPRFDCFGAPLQIANRLQATAGQGKIHVSSGYKEQLDAADEAGVFIFEPPRKTIGKNRNTFDSYVMLSAFVPVPDDFMASLYATRAFLRHVFAGVGPVGTGGTDNASTLLGSTDRSSVASSMKSSVKSK